ncbi:MAG: GntR family transcriptional regulator [Lautropia sp.]
MNPQANESRKDLAGGLPAVIRLRPEPVRSLTEEAYQRLEEMIVTLELAPGSVVSEAILSERLGIGTTPIREALQRLAREYLVQILPRRGVVVTAIDVRQQLQVLETRRELDRLIAVCATRRSLPAERQRIGAVAAAMEAAVEAGDVRGFLRLDGDLNTLAALAARNEIAASTVATLHSVSRRFWFYHQQDNPRAPRTMALHVGLARAIASGDEAAAATASEALTEHLFDFARGTLIAA